MPNWCFNEIRIKTKDKKTAASLFQDIEKWTSKEFVPSDFGNMWLGNILGNSGLDLDPVHSKIRCRGYIDEFLLEEDTVCIRTESAWSPSVKMWQLVVDEMYPDSEITYTAEENNNDIFWTNDKDLAGRYIIDSSNDKLESDWDGVSKENVIKILQDFLITNESDIDELIDLANEEDVYIHQYEFVDDINDL